jgi:hypothetical protein
MPAQTPEPTVPRYKRFLIRYPNATFDSYYLIEGGGTLREVQMEHPLAAVEAYEDSLVIFESGT